MDIQKLGHLAIVTGTEEGQNQKVLLKPDPRWFTQPHICVMDSFFYCKLDSWGRQDTCTKGVVELKDLVVVEVCQLSEKIDELVFVEEVTLLIVNSYCLEVGFGVVEALLAVEVIKEGLVVWELPLLPQ